MTEKMPTLESHESKRQENFSSLEEYKKYIRGLVLASSIFLASFGSVEAQRQGNYPDVSEITLESGNNIEKKLSEIDSLADLLVDKATEKGLATKENERMKNATSFGATFSYHSNKPGFVLYNYEGIATVNNKKYVDKLKNIYFNNKEYMLTNYIDDNNKLEREVNMIDYDGPIPRSGCMSPDATKISYDCPVTSMMGGLGYKPSNLPHILANKYKLEDLTKSLDELEQGLKDEIKSLESKR